MNPTIDWRSIDTVLLDMDGTILDLAFDNYFWLEFLPQKYADKNSLTLAQSKKFLAESYSAIEGKLQWYCLDFWSERLQLDIVELKHSVKHRVAFRPGALAFLKFLVAQKKTVYLVTNAHPKSLEIKLLMTDFHQYFCDLNSSHYFGFPKEEQKYWQCLQTKYQFDRQTTLFVDDNVTILQAAKQFGIQHLYGIKQPDLSRESIKSKPFEAIEDFEKLIEHQ